MRYRLKVPSIALVGRSNVGKSTLFNRLTGTRSAIVCDRPGVTVDRHEHLVSNRLPMPVQIVDTGGVGRSLEGHPLAKEIEAAATHAIKSSDILLLVVDGTTGPLDDDTSIARWIRKDSYKDKSDIIVVVNKVDRKDFDADEFYKLGFSDVVPVSAEHSTGIEDLWDLLKAKLEAKVLSEPENTEKPGTEILVLGRPNVGKSTLMNRVIGENRHVVSDVAGTTRDPIASDIRYHDFTWRLFDTAGLRRPGRRERGVEWVAGNKVKDLAAQADVAMLIVDANEGVTDMDAAIGGMAVDFGMSVLVIYNKWDLITGEEKFDKLLTLERTKDMKLEFLEWCPQLKISAKTGRGTEEILPIVERLVKARQYRVQTSKLNEFFNEYVKEHEHPAVEGNKRVSFYYITQTNISPPTFVLFTNVEPNKIHFSFRRYLVNSLRKAFPFEGSPIKLHFKKH
ncbi:MAG: ribosome biogenesis GTPase Der [Proteobacteria bacterium]|nr:ribosome biogenesis GTPase Der [Pseudomonadota bacterium]